MNELIHFYCFCLNSLEIKYDGEFFVDYEVSTGHIGIS